MVRFRMSLNNECERCVAVETYCHPFGECWETRKVWNCNMDEINNPVGKLLAWSDVLRYRDLSIFKEKRGRGGIRTRVHQKIEISKCANR